MNKPIAVKSASEILNIKVLSSFTIYSNTKNAIPVKQIFRNIKKPDSYSLRLINEIRQTKDKVKRNLLKRGLRSTQFSFDHPMVSKSKDINPSNYTGLIIIDIDNEGFPKNTEINDLVCKLSNDHYILALWRGPSFTDDNLSIKLLIYNPYGIDKHKDYFLTMESYLEENYGLCVDKSGKDIVRNCFMSHDSNLHYNKSYVPLEISDVVVSPKKSLRKTIQPTSKPDNGTKFVSDYLKNEFDDMSKLCGELSEGVEYEEWVILGYCLTGVFGNSDCEKEAYLAYTKVGCDMDSYDVNAVSSTWNSCKNNNNGLIDISYIYSLKDKYL